MLWVLIIIFIIALDQLTKYLVMTNIAYGSDVAVIENFFYLTYVKNKGAAWSIFQNGRYFLIAVTIITTIVMSYILVKYDNKMLRLSISFIIGGAVGNLIDRIFRGAVVDFLDFYIGRYNFPTYNVADMFVVFGTVIMGYFLLFIYKDNNSLRGNN